MTNSHIEMHETYNLLIEKRKKLWYTLFNTFQNVSAHSEDIAIEDLPTPRNSTVTKSNTSSGNNKDLSVTLHSNEDLSADDANNEDMDDTNNEGLDDVSEAGSEDIAKFSDSDDDGDDQTQVKRVFVYQTDTDGDEDLSEVDEDSSDSCGEEYWSEVANSRIHDTGDNDNDDASECSNDNDNVPQNNDVCQSKKKRKYSETELENNGLEEKPLVKKFNHVFEKVNVYINANESDFETDSEYLEL